MNKENIKASRYLNIYLDEDLAEVLNRQRNETALNASQYIRILLRKDLTAKGLLPQESEK